MNITVNDNITTVLVLGILSAMIFLNLFRQLNVKIGIFNPIHTYLDKVEKKNE
ncbi:MAG: hypothetical protein RR942_15885 [Romboutsia sp.]